MWVILALLLIFDLLSTTCGEEAGCCIDYGNLSPRGVVVRIRLEYEGKGVEDWAQLDSGCLTTSEVIWPMPGKTSLGLSEDKVTHTQVPMADGSSNLDLETADHAIVQVLLCQDAGCGAGTVRAYRTAAVSFANIPYPVLCLMGQEKLRIGVIAAHDVCCNSAPKCARLWPMGGIGGVSRSRDTSTCPR